MNLKKYVLVFVAILSISTHGFSQSFNYEISGAFPGADKILLAADIYGGKLLDSTTNENGKFHFKGSADNITLGTLIVEDEDDLFSRYYNLFIEPGKVKVKLYKSGRQIAARGTKNNDIMTEVEYDNREFYEKVTPLYDSINYASMHIFKLRKAESVQKDSIKYYENIAKRAEMAASPYIEKRNKNLENAFKKYPNSFFTAYYALNSLALPKEELKAIYNAFDDKIKNSEIGKQWQNDVLAEEVVSNGMMAPEFTAKDVDGKVISLSDFKGKYVLLDFWATWCGPCRASNPHLIELYNTYKSKGVEFIGISDDDRNVNGWKKAIQDDGIGIWPQVLRNRDKGSESNFQDIANLYGVKSYPTKILIDKEGRIINANVAEDLDAILEELL